MSFKNRYRDFGNEDEPDEGYSDELSHLEDEMNDFLKEIGIDPKDEIKVNPEQNDDPQTYCDSSAELIKKRYIQRQNYNCFSCNLGNDYFTIRSSDKEIEGIESALFTFYSYELSTEKLDCLKKIMHDCLVDEKSYGEEIYASLENESAIRFRPPESDDDVDLLIRFEYGNFAGRIEMESSYHRNDLKTNLNMLLMYLVSDVLPCIKKVGYERYDELNNEISGFDTDSFLYN
ncbi:MAG: hypothetical protein ACLFPQ_01340 [Candidatus Woesearchaeota archaeon]